jgi:hypothetical protein
VLAALSAAEGAKRIASAGERGACPSAAGGSEDGVARGGREDRMLVPLPEVAFA